MLQALFGLPDVAIRTLEVYTSGTLEAALLPPAQVKAEWRECMDRLRDEACAAFRAIVYDESRFVEYFRTATPENELGTLRIGSRPARRQAGDDIRSLRAIPWQFAWTQTRLLLADLADRVRTVDQLRTVLYGRVEGLDRHRLYDPPVAALLAEVVDALTAVLGMDEIVLATPDASDPAWD